ncbi:MAG: phage major capsid protein [Clostridiales bacterium]|nr:phage major capsid protein [Clostridiales bacterium]
MVTLQTAENALKSVYLGTITDIMNTKVNPLLTKIEQTATDVWGKEVHTACKVGLNGGFGAGTETGPLPTAKENMYVQFVSTLKNLYGKIEISDKAIRAGSDERGAFTDVLNAEIEGLLNASKFNLGRMLYGDGSGYLCYMNSGSVADGYIVDDTRNLAPGMLVDIVHDGEMIGKSIRILDVDYATKKIKIDANGDYPDGNLYVQGSKDNELTGLEAIFGDSEYLYGNRRSDIASVLPTTKALNSTLDEIVMQEVIDNVENHANSTINFIGVSANVKYAYQEYMAQYKRNIDIMNLDGGFKSLSFNGIPLVYDRFIKSDTMYLLDTTKFKLHQLCDWRFLENINGKILHQSEGKPVYTATLVKYCDLICSNPKGQAKITGIMRG